MGIAFFQNIVRLQLEADASISGKGAIPSPIYSTKSRRLRNVYAAGVRPIRLGRVVEGKDPVVIRLAARHVLAEGSYIAGDGGIEYTE